MTDFALLNSVTEELLLLIAKIWQLKYELDNKFVKISKHLKLH